MKQDEPLSSPCRDFANAVESIDRTTKLAAEDVCVLRAMKNACWRFVHSVCYFCGDPHHLTRGVVELHGKMFTVYGHSSCFPLDHSA